MREPSPSGAPPYSDRSSRQPEQLETFKEGESQQHNAQIEIVQKQEELKLYNTVAEDGPVEQADSTNSQPQLGVAEAYDPAEMALLSKKLPE